MLFDLRTIKPEELSEELDLLMSSGYTPEMEVALAKFAGKIVEITFQEKKRKRTIQTKR